MTTPVTPPLPAEDEAARAQTLARAKACVWQLLHEVPGPGAAAALARTLQPGAPWHVFHPINELAGAAQVADAWCAPLQSALHGLQRRTDLFFAGFWEPPPAGQVGHSPPEIAAPGCWVTAMGHYIGTFRQPWLGIPPTGEPVTLRFGEFYRWEPGDDGRGVITEARVLLDIVDLARQAGRPLLPPSSGLDLLVPGPATHDGLLLGPTDPAAGEESLRRTLAMFAGLFSFDGRDLNSMGMERYWHPQMMWYGPCGIGTSRGIDGFQRHHQAPFLHAFPDRRGAGHRARFAEGAYVASTGWPSVRATHAGSYLGVPATGRAIGMRVADWWRREGTWLAENWVLIDLPHLMLQMDVDLMAVLRD